MDDIKKDIAFIKFTSLWIPQLLEFGEAIKMQGDDYYFSPHPFTEDVLRKLAHCPGKDLYYLMISNDCIMGYGFLRGWEEGYEIPSLGIAIQPKAQCAGLGKYFMSFLHDMASRMGAEKVRLRVRKDNEKAIILYKKLNYCLEEDIKNTEYLIGFRDLVREEGYENEN